MSEPAPLTAARQAADHFVGRDRELREITDFLTRGQSVSVVGPPGMGKSALLRRLADPAAQHGAGLGAGILYAYLDGATLGERTPTEVFGLLAAALSRALHRAALPPEPALTAVVAQPTRLGFEAAVRRLNAGGLTVVVALDPFEPFGGNPRLGAAFFNALRSAAARLGLIFLTASQRPLIELTAGGRANDLLSSPFFNIFATVLLGPLPPDESRQLIRTLLRHAGISAGVAHVDVLYTLTGGYPLALHRAVRQAVQTPRDDEGIATRTLRELETPFTAIWHALTPTERAALRRVGEVVPHAWDDGQDGAILHGLVRKALIVADGPRLRLASGLWARFLAALPPDDERVG